MKKIISLIMIFIIFSSSVFAIDNSFINSKDEYLSNYLEELIENKIYRKPNLFDLIENNYIKTNFLEELHNEYNSQIQNNFEEIKNYFYIINLDNFDDTPQFPFGVKFNSYENIIPVDNDNEFVSNYYNKNYLKLYIEEDVLYIEGINTDSQTWSMKFFDENGKEIVLDYLNTMRIFNNRFHKKFKFYNIEEVKSLAITINTHKLNSYYPSVYNFQIEYLDDHAILNSPITYENNINQFIDNNIIPNNNYLDLHYLNDEEKIIMKDLAVEITKGLSTDYEKLLAIHKWVSNNIYYDFDSLKYNNRGKNDAYTTLIESRAVCEGYAELALALARSINIPTRLVYGYALGTVSGEDNWNEESLNANLNHVWNEAFIDNRWVIFDTTWDSLNRYEESKYIENRSKLRYFDPSIKSISQTHRFVLYE